MKSRHLAGVIAAVTGFVLATGVITAESVHAAPSTGPTTTDSSAAGTTSSSAAATTTPATTTSATTASGSGRLDVDDATLRWGMNGESGGGAFFGVCNWLSAGAAGDAGSSHAWTRSEATGTLGGLVAQVGNVTAEKPTSDGSYQPLTWENRCTAADGTTVSSATPATNTGVRIAVTGGTGTVDLDAGTATIGWQGSWTVVFYGGMTYWTVADPQLTVAADGTGTLTATAGGYGASMDDASVWATLAPRKITLAALTGVHLTGTGFTATPDYLGVTVDTGSGTPQSTTGANWGSFPQDFVDFQVATGQSSYWYSSGGARDAAKPAAPLSVSWAGGEAPPATSTSPTTSTPTTPTTTVLVTTTVTTTTTSVPGGPTGTSTSAGPSGGAGAAFTVTDAVLRWGINNESNNKAFAPGTYNILSAGKTALGGPAKTLTAEAAKDPAIWSAQSGNVRIEKQQADGSYALATFDGFTTDADGTPIGTPNDQHFSRHQVVIGAGTGEVDPAAGTATISWTGSFSVLYYSGMTYWWASDPTLTVRKDGSARLTATVGGYGADMADASTWLPLTERTVVLADLAGVSVTGARGFTTVPLYLGVHNGQPNQAGEADVFGSFPTSFVDFQTDTGQSGYWYSTKGATDRYKMPLPLTVSWSARNQLAPPTPEISATGGGSGATGGASSTISNAIRPPPTRVIAPTGRNTAPSAVPPAAGTRPVASSARATPSAISPAGVAPTGRNETAPAGSSGAPMVAGYVQQGGQVLAYDRLSLAAPATASPAPGGPAEWLLWSGGGAALLVAAGIGMAMAGFRLRRGPGGAA